MSRSNIAKVVLDEKRLAKTEDKLMRRLQKMQERVFYVRKMREGLQKAIKEAESAVSQTVEQGV